MIRLAKYLIAILLCIATPAAAWWQSVQQNAIAGAVGYQGPGDVVASAAFWGGLRAYSSATRGNAAINVCNVADVACGDLSTDATTGALIIGTIGGSSCSIVACTVKTVYDQTGNGKDFTKATISARPTLVVSCVNSLPCMAFDAASSQALRSVAVTQSAPYSYSTVGNRTGAVDFGGLACEDDVSGIEVGFTASANQMRIIASGSGFSKSSVADNTFHAIQAILNGASSALYVDGSQTTGTIGVSTMTGSSIAMGFDCQSGGVTTVQMTELGMWPVSFSAGNRSDLNSNQHTYWGF